MPTPRLWVVKDKDTTVYLFGTIHVLKPGLTWFDEAVKAAFDRSSEVKLELVMPDPADMQKLVMATGVAAPGTPPLTELLPADKRPAFTKAVVDMGLPANTLDRFKPWLAATQLSIAPLSKLGYDSANGPEEVITAAAKAQGKPVTGAGDRGAAARLFLASCRKARSSSSWKARSTNWARPTTRWRGWSTIGHTAIPRRWRRR